MPWQFCKNNKSTEVEPVAEFAGSRLNAAVLFLRVRIRSRIGPVKIV